MAVELASAYLSLIPTLKTSGLPALGDKAGTATGKRFSSGFSTAAKVGVATLGGGLAAIFKTGISEQSDFLKGQAQLQAGIKSTGGVAGVSVGQLEDLASSIQNYSGQTDDSIVASEKLLLTFTGVKDAAGKNNDIFTQATKLSADLAARMGGDASGSAIQLGKALNDPVKGITALTRIGVSFTAGQKKQISQMVKTGNTIGAQKVIIAELNKEFGGSAKAAGKTLPGQLTRAKRSFEDVSQSVVAALMPVLVSLGGILTRDIVPAFKAVVDWVIKNKKWLVPLAVTVGTIVLAWKAWTIAQAALTLVMEANPIVLVATAIAGLAAGLIYAYNHFKTFRDIVKTVFGVIKTVVSGVVSWFTIQFKAIVTAGHAVWTGIDVAWRTVGRPVFDAVKSFIGSAISVVKGLFTDLSTAWSVVSSAFSTVWNTVLEPVFEALVTGFLWVVKTVIDAADDMFGWVPFVGGKLDAARNKIDNFGGQVKTIFDGANAHAIITPTVTGIDAAKAQLTDFSDWFDNYLLKLAHPNIALPSPTNAGNNTGNGGIIFGGGKAAGGPVMKGVPYVVGEHRPELFVPDQNGTIVPKVPSGFGGGKSVTVNQTNNFLNGAAAPSTPELLRRAAGAFA